MLHAYPHSLAQKVGDKRAVARIGVALHAKERDNARVITDSRGERISRVRFEHVLAVSTNELLREMLALALRHASIIVSRSLRVTHLAGWREVAEMQVTDPRRRKRLLQTSAVQERVACASHPTSLSDVHERVHVGAP